MSGVISFYVKGHSHGNKSLQHLTYTVLLIDTSCWAWFSGLKGHSHSNKSLHTSSVYRSFNEIHHLAGLGFHDQAWHSNQCH